MPGASRVQDDHYGHSHEEGHSYDDMYSFRCPGYRFLQFLHVSACPVSAVVRAKHQQVLSRPIQEVYHEETDHPTSCTSCSSN